MESPLSMAKPRRDGGQEGGRKEKLLTPPAYTGIQKTC